MFLLCTSPTIGLPERLYHRWRKVVSIQGNFAIRISSCSTDILNKRRRRSQKSFLICIQNCNKPDFRKIDTFSQKIYTHQNINFSGFEFFDNLPTVHRINLAMKIVCFVSLGQHEIRDLFTRSLGKRKDKYSISCCYSSVYFLEHMINEGRDFFGKITFLFLQKVCKIGIWFPNCHAKDHIRIKKLYP